MDLVYGYKAAFIFVREVGKFTTIELPKQAQRPGFNISTKFHISGSTDAYNHKIFPQVRFSPLSTYNQVTV
ncbi:hypothetical protein L1987_36623 [Smallanthus sonchifolius]|uniref:Uncharacterized protein n=1 Tax=Smallanthus sonchifolius TaxID=185202 RepID=A0ACB9HFC4_9ASTR|nr:hypothetical protein L1987_36623 [Smallanthus sonchifolius]